MIRLLLTRPIHWLERRRVYSIRRRIYKAPPLQVATESAQTLVILTAPKTFDDSVWTAYSFLFQLQIPLKVNIVVDGVLDASKLKQLQELLPGAEVYNSHFFLEKLQNYPNIYQYGVEHPMGRKLALVLRLNQQTDVLYSDADVLALNSIPEVKEAMAEKTAFYICDVDKLNADPRLLDHVKRVGIGYKDDLNAGFLFVPKGKIEAETIEILLTAGNFSLESWFSEQTCMAVLMDKANATSLPKDRYVVSAQRQFYSETDVDYSKTCVRHFVSPVRPLMYLRGMPYLWRQFVKSA